MKRVTILLTIGLVTSVLTAVGVSWVAGLNPWASLGLGAAVGLSTLAAIVILGRVGSPVAWPRKELGGFLFCLGLAMIGVGLFSWFHSGSPIASVIGLLSGMLYAGLGIFVTRRNRRRI